MTNCHMNGWDHFKSRSFAFDEAKLTIDLSRVGFVDETWQGKDFMKGAFRAMAALEAGTIANPDENRMVGHYWLRAPDLAPNQQLKDEITNALDKIKRFVAEVHSGQRKGAHGPFKHLLVIGIGGSALGPQFIAHALGSLQQDRLKPWFLDNTDPDGIDRTLAQLRTELGQTLAVVISKSGKTKETRNGMLEAKEAYTRQGLKFNQHAVAVTGEDEKSDLFLTAKQEGWLETFPMWDWVGGRTSITSAVGLLPAALQGIDIESFLAGAAACDVVTRTQSVAGNPSALLALTWLHSTNGRGEKNMVILPYKDRLEPFAKYCQQLIMESLGKKLDVNGLRVNQGITVLGNKGSTDQHSYVQQLVDGVPNSFVVFVHVLRDRSQASMTVETDITAGDYLQGFLLGTRQALADDRRESLTLTIPEVTPFTVGSLIALFERAVGFYATLVNINAYHQPGVEAGKKAADRVIEITRGILKHLRAHRGHGLTAEEIATALSAPEALETVFHVCEHLSANPDRGVVRLPASCRFQARYQVA